jgi:signal transduction histidine kinase
MTIAQSGLALSEAGVLSHNVRAAKAGAADGTGALLAGASVGLAMFDKDLRLLACNETYRVLRDHTPEEVVAGARLEDLIRRVLERLELWDEQIAERLNTAMSHVIPGAEDTFRYVGPSAKLIEVHRACLPSGTLVETVRELEPSASVTDLNVQFAQIAANARQRMTHALDVMAEGFALFDADGKLVIFNRKYVECRALISDLIVRGATYETLLAEEINSGAFDLAGKSAEVFFCEGVERHRNPGAATEVRLADGRWHQINEMRTSDGGSVQTRSDITEMKEREADLIRLTRELHTRNAMFDAILDNLSQGLCLFGPDQRVVFSNDRYAEIYGLSTEHIKPGTTLKEILEARVATGVYANEDGQQFVRDGLATFSQKVSQVLRLADGRSISVVRIPMPDGSLVSTHEDVTERERLNERLAAQNMQLDAVMQNMVQGVAMYGADQRLVICNRRYIDMYNLSPEVVKPGVGLRDVMMHSASVGNYTEEEARRVLSERRDASNLTTRRTLKQHLRDGRVIAVVREPMPDGGSIATCLDITEIERHAEQMQEHTQKLERSNRELQDFAYVASHDLQEPLRKIEAFGDRLVTRYGSALPEDGRMFLDRMQNAAGRMRRLINDLLDYSRVTTKAKPFTRVELGEVLAGVLSDLQIRIEESGAVITSDSLPAIDADATQMRQLIQNVLANALKFRKADVKPEIRITCAVSEADAAFGTRGSFMRLEIADNGIGFDNKYKDQIFTIFQRLHGRLEYEGTGVGLATVRKIVERHGGAIDADGRPGIGATFIIELPMHQQAEGAAVLVAS